MVGGFSYPMSQLNRTTQSLRQPGSSIKPLIYLAALHRGLQPNTLVQDSAVTLPPIPGVTTHHWTPKNYDSSSWGTMTLRRALENSKNMVTARLLDGGIDKDPTKSLEHVCELALEARIYSECMKNYPFVLGAQALRMIDLAAFYAAIANEGVRVTPYSIDSIEQNGRAIYKHRVPAPAVMAGGDRVAFYQLRTILEGVVARGTATSLKHLTGHIGGKTGTTDSENDAWFVGFNSDVTVAVWVGYDNSRGKRTLGQGMTGGKVAVPIVEPILQAAWAYHAPKTPLPQPSAEAARRLKLLPIDVNTGRRLASAKNSAFLEYFRLDDRQRLRDTQHALVDRRHAYARGEPRPAGGGGTAGERPLYHEPAPRAAAPERPPRTLRELFGL
jgi:membrane carboxypeptidase/penicillin-binding protein